ncbi:hypothetical protein K2F45_01095 [Sphingobacterium siyangense]|uniref:hypothetical protein n=1 Tax=Sphingobacterium siyangense TaxID=459529 RepID=UPI00200FCA89|nr:hypothetical protein [Sphingobacterium siyangense]UQA75639.1 hypothetical protein K2F45_01095 [Sphingobacterium siyangense]
MIPFDPITVLVLLSTPCILMVALAFGLGVYWFGLCAPNSLRPIQMAERLLICYVLAFSSIAMLMANLNISTIDRVIAMSEDLFLLSTLIGIFGFMLATLIVFILCMIFWSQAYLRGRSHCHLFLAFLVFWFVCCASQTIVCTILLDKSNFFKT